MREERVSSRHRGSTAAVQRRAVARVVMPLAL
jgi:hypothetical protein